MTRWHIFNLVIFLFGKNFYVGKKVTFLLKIYSTWMYDWSHSSTGVCTFIFCFFFFRGAKYTWMYRRYVICIDDTSQRRFILPSKEGPRFFLYLNDLIGILNKNYMYLLGNNYLFIFSYNYATFFFCSMNYQFSHVRLTF